MSETATSRTTMRYCLDCAAMLQPGAQFCAACGSPTDGSSALVGRQTPFSPVTVMPPPQYQQPVHPLDYMRQGAAMRAYTTPALITLALYFFFWFPGLIANVIYLFAATDDKRKSGLEPQGRGCLVALMVVFVALPILGFVGLIGMGVVGGLLSAASTPTR